MRGERNENILQNFFEASFGKKSNKKPCYSKELELITGTHTTFIWMNSYTGLYLVICKGGIIDIAKEPQTRVG